MVNKFGMIDCAGNNGSPGPVGPRGPAGASGFNDLIRWFPEMVLKEIRSTEFCCLKIDNPISDLVIDDKTSEILKWNSLLTKKKTNAVAVRDFSSKEYIKVKEEVYALKFNGQTLYRLLSYHQCEVNNGFGFVPHFDLVSIQLKMISALSILIKTLRIKYFVDYH